LPLPAISWACGSFFVQHWQAEQRPLMPCWHLSLFARENEAVLRCAQKKAYIRLAALSRNAFAALSRLRIFRAVSIGRFQKTIDQCRFKQRQTVVSAALSSVQ
jgi:hypothetical protein